MPKKPNRETRRQNNQIRNVAASRGMTAESMRRQLDSFTNRVPPTTFTPRQEPSLGKKKKK